MDVINVDRPGDFTSIFLLPEDVLKRQVLPFLKLKEVACLDSALAKRSWRNYFHASLNGAVLNGAVDIRYLNWCRVRKSSANTLVVTTDIDNLPESVDGLHFETLEFCATAKVAEHALYRMVTNIQGLRTLNVQWFYSMCLRHVLPLNIDLPLLEINASGNYLLHEDTLVAIVKRCPLLRVMDATRCYRFGDKLPRALAEHCSHLREVRLTAFGRFDETNDESSTGYCELFRNCPKLQVVHCVGSVTVANIQTLADSCRELTSVTLQSPFQFSLEEPHIATLVDAPLISLAQNNINIHTLKLSYYSRLSDASLFAVAQFLPYLKTFCLDYCHASLTALAAIRTNCTQLTTFEVYRHRCPYTFRDVFDYRNLDMSILTELSIYCTTLSDTQLVTLAQANPNMRKLSVSSSVLPHSLTITSSNALCEALSHLPNLDSFDVGMFYAGLPLNARGVLRLQDSVLYALVQHCRNLTSINVSGHLLISNTAMGALSNLPRLRVVNFRQCVNLLDRGVIAIAQHCPLLADVNLSHCPHITNVGIDALARCCGNLTTTFLRGCGNISNGAIQHLIRHARHLQMLDITQNPQLTFAAVAELPQYCFYMGYLRLFPTTRPGRKPIKLEFYGAYRRNRRYFDIVFGWSEELRANQNQLHN